MVGPPLGIWIVKAGEQSCIQVKVGEQVWSEDSTRLGQGKPLYSRYWAGRRLDNYKVPQDIGLPTPRSDGLSGFGERVSE